MRGIINLSDSQNRDSRVNLETKLRPRSLKMINSRKQPVKSCRVVKGTLDTSFRVLTQDCEPEELSKQLIEGDPEIDMELFGKQIEETSRLYLNSNDEPAYGVRLKEFVYQPDGTLKEERDFTTVENNINGETPLKWNGRLMPKEQCFNKFAFTNIYQLSHIDGLTYDFLYGMAKELEDKNALLYLGSGAKGNQPLIFQRNGVSYRGFLEGRTQDDKYMLMLHITNLELKPLPQKEEE